ncbi:MAG TPA: site-specific DNA-methyltransferase [Streptosporangiaceae bacterium]|nr:site-specific DNA-methyltransferase [Streptosporangiaceae bacterium]
MRTDRLGPFPVDAVTSGDCRTLIQDLPADSVDVVVTSPPYWGQRTSAANGIEADPRSYLNSLTGVFAALLPKMKPAGILWVNLGDAYNTPVNWRPQDRAYSTLGMDGAGLSPANSAYTKPRYRRRAFVTQDEPWLQYGNLLALPYRLVIALSEAGWLFRGEVIWRKLNPMPEGRCRRPHRQHEAIYLFARTERHGFRTTPPVGSVWDFGNERVAGPPHFSRFPEQLPQRCIEAYGAAGHDVVVLDPFSGSGTTGVAAISLGCSFVGFEVDESQVVAANARLAMAARRRPVSVADPRGHAAEIAGTGTSPGGLSP